MQKHSRPDQAETQQIITRAEAKALGLKRYFTGKPCKRGHVAERYTVSNRCSVCQRQSDDDRKEYFSQWKKNNKEKCRNYTASYKKRNPERGAAYMRRIRQERREELLARARELYAKRKEFYAEKRKKYQKANPEYFAVAARNRRATLKNCRGSHTKQDVVDLLASQKNKCAYCKRGCKNKYHVDHITPLTLGGSNGKNNLQILCPQCNLKKSNKNPINFANQIGMLL